MRCRSPRRGGGPPRGAPGAGRPSARAARAAARARPAPSGPTAGGPRGCVALLEPLALPRLPRRELGGTRPERLLLVAQTGELPREPLALRDARHVLGRENREREVALCSLERLVLLCHFRLPFERAELALALLHAVAHADEARARRVRL